jgi:hypothetical protein
VFVNVGAPKVIAGEASDRSRTQASSACVLQSRRAMTTLRICVAALLLSLIPLRAAHACSRIAVTSIQNLTTLPLEGSSAPRNTKLWTVAQTNAEGEFSLVDSRSVAVTLQRSTITVSGEQAVNLEILTPVSLLVPGAYVFSRGTTVLSRFTVVDEVDEAAPAALIPTVTSVVGEYFGTSSCGNPSMVSLSLGAEVALAVAAKEGETWQLTNSLGVGSGSTLELAAPAAGAQRLVVFNVDLAGNATPSEVVSVTVPAKTNGCSAVGAWPVGLLALGLLRRRRAH